MAFNHKENCANKPVKNILILGETGVGKSTWINGVANYFHYDSLDDACNKDIIVHIPVCFYQFNQMIKIGKESKNENLTQVGQSATQKPKIYTFTKGSQAYINLIDTPGFGGSSVTAKDMENLDEILAYISNMKNLDAICILLKPNISRLTLTFRYYIQQLFVRLNKSVKNNIIFCFTHSRCAMYGPGDTFPVLNEELAQKCIGMKAIYNDKNRNDKRNNCFCFDNEAFRYIVCVKNGKKFSPGIHKTYAESWNQAKNETVALFKKVDNLVPYNVADTISLTQAQNTIIALIKPMAKSLCLITEKIITSQEINYHTKASNFDNVNVKKTLLFNADSWQSSYVNEIANCFSRLINFYPTKVNEEITSDDKQEPIAKKSKLDQIEDRKTQTIIKVEELQKEKEIILEMSAMFSAYREINSLIAYDDAFDSYIKRMIQEKDKKVEPMKDCKIEKLKELLNCYEEMRKSILNAITNNRIGEKLNAESINKQKDKLISLKHMGETLKNDLTSSMNNLEKAQNERRQRVIGKIENVFSNTMNNNQDNFNNGKTNNNGNENEFYESLRCVTNESTHSFENQKIYAKCGNQARSEYLALFKMIDLLVPYKCFDSIEVYEGRKIAISLIKSIEECLSVINDNIAIAKNFSIIIQTESIESLNIENALKLEGVSLSINCLDYPVTVCTDKNCIECVSLGISDITKTNYKTICHEYCLLKDAPTQVTNNPKVGYCDAFSTGPKCNKCGHTYDVHMHITYTATKELEDFISEDAKKLIMAKNSKREQINEMEKQIQEKVKELQKVGEIIAEAAVKFGAFLVKIALFAYEDVLKKSTTIIELSDDKKTQIQQCYGEQKEFLLFAIDNGSNKEKLFANNIINLKDQLLNLSNQVGKTFRDVLTSVNNCSQKMKNIRQKCTIRKVETSANYSAKNICKDHYDKRKVFCFNIEAFRYLECTLDEKEFRLGTQETYLGSWNQCKSKPLALFKMTDSLVAYNCEDAVIANQARKISSALFGPIVECKNLINNNIRTVIEFNNKIQKSNFEVVNILENLKFESILLPTNRIIHPLTICIHRNCFNYISVDISHINNTICKTICRNHCLLKDAPTKVTKNPKMEYCDVFRSDQKCNLCDHTYNDHMQITYTAKQVKVELLSVEAEKEIIAKKLPCEQIEELKRQTLKKIGELEEERKVISNAFVTIRAFLVKNALVAYNNVFGEYIELMLKDEEEKPKLLKDVTIEERKNILLHYKELKKTILDAISNGSNENYINPGNIYELKDQLISLKNNGKIFANVLATVV